MREHIIQLIYLVAAVGFALSLKWMSSAATARRGIMAGEVGFVLAIGATLALPGYATKGVVLIVIALVLGAAIGVPLGLRVPMTAMPERIALSHAFGALAVASVGIAHYFLAWRHLGKFELAVLGAEILLGGLVFTGSLMAAGKLHEKLPQRPILFPGQNYANFGLIGVGVVIIGILMFHPSSTWLVIALAGLALVIGVLLIIPIGGADMPTVIALLNSYAGLSAAALGMVLISAAGPLSNVLIAIGSAVSGL